jgi:tripeptidyl-peptidase-1
MVALYHMLAALAVVIGVGMTAALDAEMLDIVVHLRPTAGPSALEDAFWAISTPGNPLFRRFLDLDQLKELLAPRPGTVGKVVSILEAEGAQEIVQGRTGEVLFASLPANHRWIQAASQAVINKRRQYTPSELSREVEAFTVPAFADSHGKPAKLEPQSGVTRSAGRRAAEVTEGKKRIHAQVPGMNVGIYTMRYHYSVPWEAMQNNSKAAEQFQYSHAVAEFEGEQFYQSNVAAFNAKYPPLPTNPIINVSGPNNGGYFGEGNLDLEYIGGMAPGVVTWWVAHNQLSYSKLVESVLALSPLPSVLSISWGSGEQNYDSTALESDNKEFKKLGVLGISVFASSGDHGTGSTGFFSCGTFDPTWPATSPYLTSVGATYLNTNESAEIAWDRSGGGFSSVFPMPSYQEAAINHYLNHTNVTLPAQQFWARGGRGIPDVASLGCNAEVYSSGWGTESGTSIAAPTFAGMISQIIIARRLAGLSNLGFINPSLYQLGCVGQDILEGDNKYSWCPAGFQATNGWDPISGLGTANFTLLMNHFMSD